MNTFFYSYAKEAKQNPYVGFTSFQHLREEPLYSDLVVRPENNLTETEHVECYPIPAYVEQKGREQGYYPDCSLAYYRFLWKEFEPREGEYRFDFVEKILAGARASGQTVMLRMMQHSTRERDDVPQWLKEKIPCPARPEGKRVKECPSDPLFLQCFARAVRALGQRFDSDPTLALVDVSLPGAWGEGSHCSLFTSEQLKDYVSAYPEAFPTTPLIGQACYPALWDPNLREGFPGWRADCIGPTRLLDMVQGQNEALSHVWKRGHISFESYWWLGEWMRQGWDVDLLFEKMLSWHVSSFNAKSLPIPQEWKDRVDRFVSRMGYHFTLQSLSLEPVTEDRYLKGSICLENCGVAPIYHSLPLYLKWKTSDGETLYPLNVDIRTWLPGKHSFSFGLPLKDLSREGQLQIGIGGGDAPSVLFANQGDTDGDFFVLAKLILS